MEVTQVQVRWLLVNFLHDKHLLNRKYNLIPFINKFNESFLTNLSARCQMVMLTVSVNKYTVSFVHYKLRPEFKLQTIPIYCHAVLWSPSQRDPYFKTVEDPSQLTFLLLNYSIHREQTHRNQICLNWRAFLVYYYFMVFWHLSLMLTFIPNWQRNFLQNQWLQRTVQNYTSIQVKGYCAIVDAHIILYISYLMIFLQLAKHFLVYYHAYYKEYINKYMLVSKLMAD